MPISIIRMNPLVILLLAAVQQAVALANCPSSCDCNDDTLVVTCGEGHLDVLPIALNPSIQRLIIKNNKIKTIDSSMQFYSELTYIALSYNHLFNIPAGTFTYQRRLAELHLNHNKIGSISNRTFVGLGELAILNLRGNFLDELGANVFSMLTKLEELNLGQNRIARIDAQAFAGLGNLRILYLDDNNLSAVESTAFLPLSNLAELFLGLNSFSALSKDAFQNLRGLSRLDLRGAALSNITTESFNGLEGLRVLDLSDNRLTRVPTVELSALQRLEELSLGQNDFEVIPEGAFQGLTNLRTLDITGSIKLRRIETNAFTNNANLESLTIASNKALAEVQEGAFSGLPHLKSIVLRDNALTTLAEGLFPWVELQTLDLSENPIICDCRVLWLRNVLVSKNSSVQQQSPVICAAPERLREESLTLLSADLLGCHHRDPRQQALIGALCVSIAAIATALALLIFRCRRRLWEFLKGGFGSSSKSRKEREYQKTFSEEEGYVARHPHCLSVHSTLNNYQPNHHHHHGVGSAGIRAIPVTEL